MSYLLRCEENMKAIELEQHEAGKPSNQGEKAPDWESPRPGDVIIDRALRSVYVLAKDGSRRRCRDSEAANTAINFIKKRIAEVEAKKITTLGKYA